MTAAARSRLEVLAAVVQRLGRRDEPVGQQAREIAAREGDLSAAMADWALSTACARYTPEALAALPEVGGRRVGVVLSASVATAPIRALIAPLAGGAGSLLVRASRRQPALAGLVVDELAAAGLPVELGPIDRGAWLARAVADGVEIVHATGSDEAIAALDEALPPSVGFVGRAHGFGVAYVAADGTGSGEVAEAVALDVAAYDQHGCLSPRLVLVEAESASAVLSLAERLHRALGAVQERLPRGPVDAALASRILQWQGATAAAGARLWRGEAHAVAAYDVPVLAGTPGGRNVAVVPIRDPAHAARLLGGEVRFVTTVGVGGGPVGEVARSFGAARITPSGTMQDPPLDGPEDPRPPLRHRAPRIGP